MSDNRRMPAPAEGRLAPALSTSRAVLLPFAARDRAELLALFRDPEVRRYLLDDAVVSPEWIDAEIRASDARFASSGAGLWAVRVPPDPTIAGFAGFREFFEPPELQLLYGLRPEHWGRGVATEVARGVCEHAFQVLGFAQIAAATDLANHASTRVLLRLGMRQRRTGETGLGGTGFYALDRGGSARRRAREHDGDERAREGFVDAEDHPARHRPDRA
jgi:[ribosomal protein S5]-alanine N-acetyltransferase